MNMSELDIFIIIASTASMVLPIYVLLYKLRGEVSNLQGRYSERRKFHD